VIIETVDRPQPLGEAAPALTKQLGGARFQPVIHDVFFGEGAESVGEGRTAAINGCFDARGFLLALDSIA
jgi:hypothetical protein